MMKYSPMSFKKEMVLKVEPPLKGMNNSDLACKIDLQEAVLLKNTIIENGCIKNRLGLNGTAENVLDISEFKYAYNVDFFLTDCEISLENKTGRIAVAYIQNDDAQHIYRIFVIFGDVSYKKIGDIYFGRVDSSTFYVPIKIVFFKGAPQSGGGIFAFVKLVNQHDVSAAENRIYEIGSDYSNWNIYNTTYIPTVYINGRGNGYEEAKANDTAYTGSPKNLETLNLLDGVFHAYYSSDGYSSAFRLPYASLANRSVSCKLYSNPNSYTEWVIYGGANESTEVTYSGKAVKMYVDRPTGTVYFKSGEADMPLPVMKLYPQNNICFTAAKETNYSFDDIISCSIAVPMGNKVFFAKGDKADKVFVCDKDNPIYFPECFNNEIGSDGGSITAMCSTGEEIIAFKEKGVYSVKLKGEKYINKIALLADNTSYFKDLGNFEITRISNVFGCKNSNTLKVLGKNPIWFSKDGEICTLKNGTPMVISQKIDSESLEVFKAKASTASVFADNYILMNGKDAIVLNTAYDSLKLYFWSFPEKAELNGAVFDGENTAFVLKVSGLSVFYTATLSKDSDAVLINDTNSKTYSVETEIVTKDFLENHTGKKRINRVVLNAQFSKELEFEVGDKRTRENFYLENNICSGENKTDVILGNYGMNSVSLTLKTKDDITFKGAEIYYSTLRD